jgi:hypothetical protein
MMIASISETPISVQISWAVIAAYGIQLLKKIQAIPFVNFETQNANRWLSALIAAAVGAGITFTFNKAAGILTMAGLTLPNIYHFVSLAIQQFAMQHGVYKTMIAPPLPGRIQEEVRRVNGGGPVAVVPVQVIPLPSEVKL